MACAFTLVLSTGAGTTPCLKPLEGDPKSRDPSLWKDLREHSPPDSEKGSEVLQFQRIDSATGDEINQDFYSITFTKLPNVTIEQAFRDMRLHFKQYAKGILRTNDFFPYPSEDIKRNPEAAKNSEIWNKEDPKGAVMRFSLLGLGLPTFAISSSDPKVFTFVVKAGDVQCTCASPRDFIFTTVTSKDGGKHPVSGNRGFGIRDNGDGTWTFYTKGADRKSSWIGNKMHDDKSIGPQRYTPETFNEGHKFWLSFFANMKSYLSSRGAKVNEDLTVINSKRDTYPLSTPGQPSTPPVSPNLVPLPPP